MQPDTTPGCKCRVLSPRECPPHGGQDRKGCPVHDAALTKPDPTPDLDELFEPGWLTRCDWCGWPLTSADVGCAEGNCSMRPMPSNADTPRKVKVRSLRARAEKAEADLAESKRLAEKAEARAKAGEILASQVLDLMEWLDALADRCDEDLENEARASIGSLALTAASAKAEEIIAGPAQGEVLSEKYAEELVRRTRASEARAKELEALVKKWPSLECPCCGEEGAMALFFEDGQETTCGCGGRVSADGENASISIDDSEDECPKCAVLAQKGPEPE